MRLIDAEELFNKVGKIVPRNTTHYKAIGEFMNMITNSPTIETKQGEWIEDYSSYRRKVKCSACGKFSGIGGIRSNQNKPYCPNCGAKMRIDND